LFFNRISADRLSPFNQHPKGKGNQVATTVLKKLPGVLSFQRGTLVTDGLFFNQFSDGKLAPLPVVRHGIRGTQNINKLEKSAGAGAATAKREEVSNIQTTDSAKLMPSATALQVRFGIRFIDLEQLLFACAPGKGDSADDIATMRKSFLDFVTRAKGSKGLVEVASRYARNIANGRWLWRNRTVASRLAISVSDQKSVIASFDGLAISLREFDRYSADEFKVAEVIAAGLRGDREANLRVVATVDFGLDGGAVEVFPSQNYLENKTRGFARPLYCVGVAPASQDINSIQEMGQAALREQKIANALRTFDTWYPDFAKRAVPIPIEPNGASLDAQEFFRNTKDASGFQMMARLSSIDPDSEEGMFMIACLIRGGVFSGSDS
jgi:CRISPR-associated protein Csy3